jgi:hypothetical protein
MAHFCFVENFIHVLNFNFIHMEKLSLFSIRFHMLFHLMSWGDRNDCGSYYDWHPTHAFLIFFIDVLTWHGEQKSLMTFALSILCALYRQKVLVAYGWFSHASLAGPNLVLRITPKELAKLRPQNKCLPKVEMRGDYFRNAPLWGCKMISPPKFKKN